MLRVAAFTGGVDVPSARFRARQYIPALRRHGIELTEFTAILGAYPPKAKYLRPFWAGATLVQRLPGIVRSYASDLVFLQREMLSTFVSLEPLTKSPRVLDVDDAIFALKDGIFASRLAGMCTSVICGNEFLAQHFRKWCSDVVTIPTAVDTNVFRPKAKQMESGKPLIIGWIGTSANLKYLYKIEQSLRHVLQTGINAKLRVVSDRAPRFRELPKPFVEFLQWSPKIELRSIQEMDIGIMPIEDSIWERGKCSYKMLLYMACGLPVVASPFGMNLQIWEMETVGIGAAEDLHWTEALIGLLEDQNTRTEMGKRGRKVVENYFSTDVITPQLSNHLRRVANSS